MYWRRVKRACEYDGPVCSCSSHSASSAPWVVLAARLRAPIPSRHAAECSAASAANARPAQHRASRRRDRAGSEFGILLVTRVPVRHRLHNRGRRRDGHRARPRETPPRVQGRARRSRIEIRISPTRVPNSRRSVREPPAARERHRRATWVRNFSACNRRSFGTCGVRAEATTQAHSARHERAMSTNARQMLSVAVSLKKCHSAHR